MSRSYDYYEEDEQNEYPTDGQPVRTRTSTRHYQPRVVDQYNDDEYAYEPTAHRLRTTEPHQRIVPARRTASRPPTYRQPVEQSPVRHPVHPQPIQQPQEMSRRAFLGITRRGLFTAAAVISGPTVIGLGFWTRSKIIHVQGQLEEGQYANQSLSIICGHNDNSANQTQLHVYLQSDGKINFIELPGGNPSKAHLNQTEPVHQTGFRGDLADLYLTINPEPVGKNKYQIRLHVEEHAVGILPSAFSQDWMLVDNGKGFFQVVNTK